MIVEITSSPFRGEAGKRNLELCRIEAERLGFEFGVQIHNTVTAEEIAPLRESGVRLSAHLPLLSDYNMNLAAEDGAVPFGILERNVELMRQFGIRDGVFHGFHMTDKPVAAFGFKKSYDACMREIFRPELSMDGACRLNNNFTAIDEFQMRRERVKSRLAKIRTDYPDLEIRIENDFPAYGSGNMFAADANALSHPICFDTSHLWATAHVMGVDFHEEAERFLDGGNVTMVHFHASRYDDSVPTANWGDGHLPLSTPNRMNLPRLVKSLSRAGVRYYVLEVVEATPEDLRALADML